LLFGNKMPVILATFLTLLIALCWLRAMDFAAQRGWVESRLSRKIIHIGTGPIFVLCWLMFPQSPAWGRYLAALVPLLFTVQFALIGSGLIRDEASVKAMSRHGDRREILRGPLFYGIVFVVMTILYWKDSPIGMTALMLMCGGDGLAEILGRRLSSPRLPWNKEKTLAGSLGMLLGGWTLAVLVLGVFVMSGVFAPPFSAYLWPLTLIALAGTLVESLPLHDVDNITVTLMATILGHILF